MPKKKLLKKAKPKVVKRKKEAPAPKVVKKAAVRTVKKSDAPRTRVAKVAYNSLFMLSQAHMDLATIIAKAMGKIKEMVEQPPHADYVAWAVPGKSGSQKRVGGLWVHGGTLCLQIRWMAPDVLKEAQKHFTVLGTPEHNLKCNRVAITNEKEAQLAIKLMEMQAVAIAEGTAPSQNLN